MSQTLMNHSRNGYVRYDNVIYFMEALKIRAM